MKTFLIFIVIIGSVSYYNYANRTANEIQQCKMTMDVAKLGNAVMDSQFGMFLSTQEKEEAQIEMAQSLFQNCTLIELGQTLSVSDIINDANKGMDNVAKQLEKDLK